MTNFLVKSVETGAVEIGEDAAHHAHVRRLSIGDSATVTDGRGAWGLGQIASLSKRSLIVYVERLGQTPPPPAVHLLVPVADRDRMLWLAEKAAELQVTSWTPVLYRRSMSVSPRGEGDLFERKVRARMVAALEQSGGRWMPELHQTVEPETAADSRGDRGIVLEARWAPLGQEPIRAPITIAIGPEGGFVAEEIAGFESHGWMFRSLGDVTLRFETAAIAALSVARASLSS